MQTMPAHEGEACVSLRIIAVDDEADKGKSMGHKDVLRHMINARSFQHSETPSFLLSSGKKSHYYFNLKCVTMTSEGMLHIGNVVLDKIEELGLKTRVKAIGGLTMGADPIANATAMVSYLRDKEHSLQAFSIRKEPKKYGLKLQIEGNAEPRDDVIIIDDVVTTGASTIKAIEIARKNDLHVMAVVVLVDRREENGRENIEEHGVKVHSIFTVEDFL